MGCKEVFDIFGIFFDVMMIYMIWIGGGFGWWLMSDYMVMVVQVVKGILG